MCFINKGDIITAVGEVPLKLCSRIKSIVIVTNDTVTEKRNIKFKFKRAHLILFGILYYEFLCNLIMITYKVENRIVNPIVVAFGIFTRALHEQVSSPSAPHS